MKQTARRYAIVGILNVIIALATLTAGSAQTVPATASGITVVGRGVVRVHADALYFSAAIYANNGRGAVPALGDLDAAAQAIAKTLRDAGVADAATGFAGAYNPSSPRIVTGSLRKFTRQSVEALVKQGSLGAAPYPNVALQNITFSFLLDDCNAPEARAQEAALADAHARAERVARAAGVRLGSVVTVNETSFGPNTFPNCPTRPDTQVLLVSRGEADAVMGDVFISVTAAVTYALIHS